MDLTRAHARLEQVSRSAALIGGLGIILIAVLVTIDVLMRRFLNTTLGGASEISGFIFAIGTALSYPYVLFDRANIRIDVAYSVLSSRIRAVLDVIAMLMVLYFVSMLTMSIVSLWLKSWESNATSIGVINVRLWIPQLFWVFGYVLFLITALLLAIYAVVELFRGNWAQVNRVAGVPSIDETIEEETYIDAESPPHDQSSKDDEENR